MPILTAAALAPQVRRLGRWQRQHTALTTPLLGGELRFTVTNSPTLTLTTKNQAAPLSPRQRWAVRIDQGEWHRFAAGRPYQLTLNPAGSLVEIMTAGNTDLDNVWTGGQDFALTGLTVAPGAQIRPATPRPRVTVFGDSIAAGCWVAGLRASLDYRPETNYLALGADQVGVDLDRVAYSAAGFLRPGAGQVPPARAWLTQLNQTTPWINPPSDLVLVALGANDRRAAPPAIRTAAAAYLQQLVAAGFARRIAILAPFDQGITPLLKTLAPTVAATFIPTTGWCPSFTDGLHPDQAGSIAAGKAFAPILKKLLK